MAAQGLAGPEGQDPAHGQAADRRRERKTLADRRPDDTVNAIVDDPAHRYIAVIGGDIHNYQRYPVEQPDGRVDPAHRQRRGRRVHEGDAQDPDGDRRGVRLRRGRLPLLPAPRRLARRLLGPLRPQVPAGPGALSIPYEQAPAIMSLLLDRRGRPDAVERPDARSRRTSWRRRRSGSSRSRGTAWDRFHDNFSEFLDWNDPDPPLFKSFLRVDDAAGRDRDPLLRRHRLRGARRQPAARGLDQGNAGDGRALELGGPP